MSETIRKDQPSPHCAILSGRENRPDDWTPPRRRVLARAIECCGAEWWTNYCPTCGLRLRDAHGQPCRTTMAPRAYALLGRAQELLSAAAVIENPIGDRFKTKLLNLYDDIEKHLAGKDMK